MVSLGERTVIGVETLVRWDHPELGPLLPDEFIPVLEQIGRIGALTDHVLDQALARCRRWLDQDIALSVAVNLVRRAASPSPTFPGGAPRAARHGVPAELLTLELTEAGVSSERECATARCCADLHALGLRLSVDDFGTGYSSLSQLRQLPDRRGQDRQVLRAGHVHRARASRSSPGRSSSWPTTWACAWWPRASRTS